MQKKETTEKTPKKPKQRWEPRYNYCPVCDGFGMLEDDTICPECDGDGEIEE